jgi:hypothetical protein
MFKTQVNNLIRYVVIQLVAVCKVRSNYIFLKSRVSSRNPMELIISLGFWYKDSPVLHNVHICCDHLNIPFISQNFILCHCNQNVWQYVIFKIQDIL